MEYLLGGDVNIQSPDGEFCIKVPESIDILQNPSDKNRNMTINSTLSNLQLDTIW